MPAISYQLLSFRIPSSAFRVPRCLTPARYHSLKVCLPVDAHRQSQVRQGNHNPGDLKHLFFSVYLRRPLRETCFSHSAFRLPRSLLTPARYHSLKVYLRTNAHRQGQVRQVLLLFFLLPYCCIPWRSVCQSLRTDRLLHLCVRMLYSFRVPSSAFKLVPRPSSPLRENALLVPHSAFRVPRSKWESASHHHCLGRLPAHDCGEPCSICLDEQRSS